MIGGLSILSTRINFGPVNSKCWKLFWAILESSFICFSLNLKHWGSYSLLCNGTCHIISARINFRPVNSPVLEAFLSHRKLLHLFLAQLEAPGQLESLAYWSSGKRVLHKILKENDSQWNYPGPRHSSCLRNSGSNSLFPVWFYIGATSYPHYRWAYITKIKPVCLPFSPRFSYTGF